MGELGTDSTSSYPGSLDTDATKEAAGNTITAAMINMAYDAIVSIETELGTDPAGTRDTVKDFLQDQHHTDGSHRFPDGEGIDDANGNELVLFQTTASAVNQFDITNAATGSGPSLTATGDDTNIDININPKGTGQIKYGGEGIERAIKNLLLNGQMRIWQRGTSFTSPSSLDYGPDRWSTVISGDPSGKFDISQSADVPSTSNAAYSLQLAATATDTADASDLLTIVQHIEGHSIQGLDWGLSTAKDLTLSFDIKTVIAGTPTYPATYTVALFNNGGNPYYIAEYTVTADSTWEHKTISIAGPTTGTWLDDEGRGISLHFVFHAGSDREGTANVWSAAAAKYSTTSATNEFLGTSGNDIYITNVQLEVGDVPTDIQILPYALELEMCKRYFERLSFSSNSGEVVASGFASTTSTGNFPVRYVEKRTTPSITATDKATFEIVYQATATDVDSALNLQVPGVKSCNVQAVLTTTPLTAGDGLTLRRDATDTCYIDVSAEL